MVISPFSVCFIEFLGLDVLKAELIEGEDLLPCPSEDEAEAVGAVGVGQRAFNLPIEIGLNLTATQDRTEGTSLPHLDLTGLCALMGAADEHFGVSFVVVCADN